MSNNCVTAEYPLAVAEAAVVPGSIDGCVEYGMFQTLAFLSATENFTLRFSTDQDAVTITTSMLPLTIPAYSETIYLAAAAPGTVSFVADVKVWSPLVAPGLNI